MNTATPVANCSYALDQRLVISAVGGGWDQFAIENGAPSLVAPNPVGQPLLMYLSDPTTVHLYELLFDRVTSRRKPITFPIRCDGAVLRRFLNVTVAPRVNGGFAISTVLVRSERRRAIPMMLATVKRSGDFVTMCSWCKRVKANTRWVEVEEAMTLLQLFERDDQPELTHGVCEPCQQFMLTMLADDSKLPSP